MPRIKYYIFVFLVLIASQIYPQNSIEEDSTLKQNEVEVVVINAEKEIQNGNFYNLFLLNILNHRYI